MSEFKGTKGKWEYHGGDNSSIDIVLPNDTTISISRHHRYKDSELVGSRTEMEANALLISKAPEMLEMLIMINEGIHTMDFAQLEILQPEIEQLIQEATEI